MAVAEAKCVCKTCGKTFTKTAYKRNRSEANSWEEWAEEHFDECNECYSKRMQEAAIQRRKEVMQDVECPTLIGSDKQVEWAERIRADFVKYFKKNEKELMETISTREKNLSKYEGNALESRIRYQAQDKEELEHMRLTMRWTLSHENASWWINNREDLNYRRWYEDYYEDALQWAKPVSQEEKEFIKDVKAESTVIPENRKHDGVVEITTTDNEVSAIYAKDDDFREIVKDLGFKWDGSNWVKMLTITTGTAQDRTAELGNKLLNAGFAICIIDPVIRQAAVDAKYEPECKRWIWANEDLTKFFLEWEYGNDKIYQASRRIHGSKWSKPYVSVPKIEFKAILDFVDIYGFKLTPGAQQMIKEMQGNTGTIVKPAPTKDVTPTEHNVLNSSREVIADLRDDD